MRRSDELTILIQPGVGGAGPDHWQMHLVRGRGARADAEERYSAPQYRDREGDGVALSERRTDEAGTRAGAAQP